MIYNVTLAYSQYDLFRFGPDADRVIRDHFSHELGKFLGNKVRFTLPRIPTLDEVGHREMSMTFSREVQPTENIQFDYVFMPLAQWESIRRQFLYIGELGGHAVEEQIVDAILRVESEEPRH